MTTFSLNQGQDEAAQAFFAFLFGPDPYFIISGPGGVGKTALMSYLIDKIMPQYFDACKLTGISPEYDDVVMTATTNKAAEVLSQATHRDVSTIHSFLNLKVKDDFTTGKQNLVKTNGWKVHERKILFIDESSMIDRDLLTVISEGMHKSKVVFVGDHCQLAPITEPISPIYRRTETPFYHLTQQMRNNGQPALMDLCQQLRTTVETGEFKPIRVVPGVIDHLDDTRMQAEIARQFTTPSTDHRILSYSNNRVIQYNEHIRDELRQLPHEYQLGENLVNTSAIRMKNGMLSVEEEVKIIRAAPDPTSVEIDDGVNLLVRDCDLQSKHGGIYANVMIPCDRNHFAALLEYYRKVGKSGGGWGKYYELKNIYPDLRQFESATVHKSQGSTYDSVFIDLANISSCNQPNVVARLLYVACSRPRHRIFLYGQLADKYGGLIQ